MAIELTNLRSKTMKVFDLGNGQRLSRCHIGNIHYPDSSKVWQDIDTTLKTRAGGLYQDKCFYSCETPDKADGDFVFFNRDHHFDLRPVGVNSVGYKPVANIWGQLGKGIEYTNAFGDGIHLEILARNMAFDKIIRFDKPPSDPTRDFIVEFEILTLPSVFEVADENGAFTAFDPKTGTINKDKSLRFGTAGKFSHIIRPSCYSMGFMDGPDQIPMRIRMPIGIRIYKKSNRYFLQKIIPKEIFQDALYPIFADDPTRYDPPAGDGTVGNTSYANWDSNHDATSGTADYTSSIITPGVFRTFSTNHKIWRAFIPIDTSGIPDGDSITAATIYMHGESSEYRNNDDDGDDWVSIVQTSQSSVTSLASGDFDLCGDAVDNPTEGNDSGDRIDIGSWSTSAYNTIDLNATGRGWIDKTGDTKLGLREGHDCIDSQLKSSPNNIGNIASMYTSEQTGTSQDPYLDVTHSAAGETITVTKMALDLAGQSAFANEALTVSSVAHDWAGKETQENKAITLAKFDADWAGGATQENEAITPAKASIDWAGQSTFADELIKLAKASIDWAGQDISFGEVIKITKATLNWAGQKIKANEAIMVALKAVDWAGQSVIALEGVIVSVTKMALDYVGNAIKASEAITIATKSIDWAGKAVSVAAQAVKRGLSKLGQSLRLD